MNKTELLLQRLDEIGQSLKDSKQALALLALGSCGTERERLDQYSDLDFFVIVKDGYKQTYIQDLTLSLIHISVGVFNNSFRRFVATL